MSESKKGFQFNAFLIKEEYSGIDYGQLIKYGTSTSEYHLATGHNLEGKLFIKNSSSQRPKWGELLDQLTGTSIDQLFNRSSSALLVIRTSKATIAYTFGYGRFLIDPSYCVQDFGIKTALNTLDHTSLRSVDLLTFGEQAIQTKSQANRATSVDVFGIDISQDLLRAVTGFPISGVEFTNISGGGLVYSFGTTIDINNLSELTNKLSDLYNTDSYKESFSWVDNIVRVKEKSLVDQLDQHLIDDIRQQDSKFDITIPEIIKWDEVSGFSFTRSKTNIKPVIEVSDYLDNLDLTKISIDLLKRDRLFVHDIHENQFEHSIYRSIYFEIKKSTKTYILFSSIWYEIDDDFTNQINNILDQIEISNLPFPEVHTWTQQVNEKTKLKIEAEGNYNERVARELSYHLLDKKLIKTNRSTSSIELCDLLTDAKQFVHVKHRKGGSAGLSHLFAQGSVAAQVMLSDKDFRKASRKVLRSIDPNIQDLITLERFSSSGVEIVYLILGEAAETIKDNLPFFSKVNLTKAYEDLSQRGYKVSISGVAKKPIDQST